MKTYRQFDENKRIAICLYGPDNSIETSEFEKRASELFPEYTIIMFRDVSPDKFKSLHKVAFSKRSYEIQTSLDFKFCIGVSSESIENIEICSIPDVILNDTVYFTKGYYSRRGRTCICLNSFICNTLEFDRSAEVYCNLGHIDKSYTHESEIFYYHLKSLKFKTECVNFENSNLFIRAASFD